MESPLMRVAFLLVVIFCTTACATSTQPKQSIVGMDFLAFLHSAESHSAANQVFPYPTLKLPILGNDFVLTSMKSQPKVFTSYGFASDPCVPRDLIAPYLSELNYVQLPPGLPTSHAGLNGRDTYTLGGRDGTRSINVEFWSSGDNQCLKHMFIDFPE